MVDHRTTQDIETERLAFLSSRKELEQRRQELEDQQTEFYSDRRGGVFVVINGKRVHESDLPSASPLAQPVAEVIDHAAE